MKNEIQTLMQENDLEALLVMGPAQHNPAMVYFTGLVHVSKADLILRRGAEPVLFHGSMERDEAAQSGLPRRDYEQYPWKELQQEAGGDTTQMMALRYERMLRDCGVTQGRVAIYGQQEIGPQFAILNALQQRMPELTLVGFVNDPILSQAMFRKDETELAHIRHMGQITTSVVGRVADFLSSQHARDGLLLDKQGQPVTIGRVKSLIDLWLAEAGAENPEGTIFAQGRDAGVPHSTGNDAEALRLGQTIVFDIFPCQARGGYFYDFTRTWCLGYAPDEALQLYEQVRHVYETIRSELQLDAPFRSYHERTCELFEAMGHPTLRTHPGTQSGFVHSLGHGLGLRVHERPWSSTTASAGDILAAGTVFTIEPGLYYPERGLGVRLEDTYTATPDGHFAPLADFPLDLVLPVHG